jgi:selenocysteine lyase/cysteine desulfurase
VKKCGIHFLASGGHKWLLSAMGCGVLFISRDVDNLVHPERVGWKSVIKEKEFFRLNFDLKADALRFESGTMNVAGIYALGAALDLLLEVGVENIYERILAINDSLHQGLKKRKVQIITAMVTVSLRDHMIRLSPHFYNNSEDVERFFQVFDNF